MQNVSHLQDEQLKIKNFLSWITTSLTSNCSSQITYQMTNTNIFLVFAHSLPSEFKSFVSCYCCTWHVLTLTHIIIFHSNLINTTHWTINSISLLHYSLQCSLYTHTVYVTYVLQIRNIILHGPYQAPRLSKANFREKLLYPHLKQLWTTKGRRILYSDVPHGPFNMESFLF